MFVVVEGCLGTGVEGVYGVFTREKDAERWCDSVAHEKGSESFHIMELEEVSDREDDAAEGA